MSITTEKPEPKTPQFCPNCGKKYPDEVNIRSEIVSDTFPHVWVCYHCGHRWIDLKIAEWNADHPAPEKFPDSTKLLEMARTEWKNREERRGIHAEVPFVAGWINGYLTRHQKAPKDCAKCYDDGYSSGLRESAGIGRENTIEDYSRVLKQKITESTLPANCFDRLSMLIHDTVVTLRQQGESKPLPKCTGSTDRFLCHNDVHNDIAARAARKALNTLLETIKNTNDEICGSYGMWEMNSTQCQSFDGNCTLCKVTKAITVIKESPEEAQPKEGGIG